MHVKVDALDTLLVLLLAFGWGSCTRRTQVESVTDMKVNLSLDEMMLYPADKCDTLIHPRYRYIVYVDSSECSPCKIIHMGIWNHFQQELSDADVAFHMIFYPPKDKVVEMVRVYDSYRHTRVY